MHGTEETGGGEGIVAGAADRLDADGVGFQLLLLREGGERPLAGGKRQLATGIIVEHVVDHAADHQRVARLLLALGGMVGDDVAHLVGEHRGDLGGIVGQRQQAAGDVEVAVRQREGVHRRRVEDGDPVGLVGLVRGGDDLADDRRQRLLHLGVVEDAAIGRHDACVLAAVDGVARRLATVVEDVGGRPATIHERIAAGERHGRQNRSQRRRPTPARRPPNPCDRDCPHLTSRSATRSRRARPTGWPGPRSARSRHGP